MSDEELKHYLPSYGDCLAVFAFCRRRDNSPSNTRKTKLYERLKNKLSKRNSCEWHSSSHEGQPSQKKNAIKTIRKTEIGWMHYDNEKEVFKWEPKRGGGTRKLSVSKDAHKKQLIQEAVHLFFPNGRNGLGSLTDFELGLTNYQEVPLDEVTTVGKLYQEKNHTDKRIQ